MGLSLRTFIIDQTGEWLRIPSTVMWKLVTGDTERRFPSFADRRLRIAEAVIELMDRKAIDVVRTYYYFGRFRENGTFDREAFREDNRLFSDMHSSPYIGASNIVDARSRFTHRRTRWKPTPSEQAALRQLALGKRT